MENNYDPEIYDIMHSESFGGDIEWYCQLASIQGGPVLELGAGTGRTVLPIAQAGIEIHALEKDQGMLEKLRSKLSNESPETQKNVKIIEGDMRQFDIPTRYKVIQIPFRTFLNNRTHEDQLSCLHCCHSHLLSDGVLAMNMFHPSLDYMSQNRGSFEGVWRWRGEQVHPEGGIIVQSESNRFDTVKQQVSSRLRFEHFDRSGNLLSVHLQLLELSYLYPGDIRDLLNEAGFSSIQIWGGFDGRVIDRDGGELVVQAHKSDAVT